MESAIKHLEKNVEDADGKLDMIVWQIDSFEKEFKDPQSDVTVLGLLKSVTQVKEEYQSLRQDIHEVQQLQKQLSQSLRMQLKQVHSRYNLLRSKIVEKTKPNQLEREA